MKEQDSANIYQITKQYEDFTLSTAVYPEAGMCSRNEINYLIHGLTGEAGEIANYFKKILRNDAQINYDHSVKIIDELGDCLWYITRLADALGFSLRNVIEFNKEKLNKRKNNNELRDHT